MKWLKRFLAKLLIKDIHKRFLQLERSNQEKDMILAMLGCPSSEDMGSVKKRTEELEKTNARLEEENDAMLYEGIAWAEEAQASRVVIADLKEWLKRNCDRCGDSGELCFNNKCPFYDVKEILAGADEKPIIGYEEE